MEYRAISPFSFDYKSIVIDEIALEGLEGIGIELLWKRIEYRISAPVTDKLKLRLWNFILKYKELSIYQLPEPAVYFEPLNRFDYFHEDTGLVLEPKDYIDGPYELCPVEKVYGSCKHYKTRKLLDKNELINLEYDKVLSECGQYLVLVASMEERWKALAPHASISVLPLLQPAHYFMLELIGKARENGQMTFGKTNLLKITKDAKLLYLHRKQLVTLDLVRVQGIVQYINKGVKGRLIHLKRFYQPSIVMIPNGGKMFELREYLKQRDGYTELSSVAMKEGVLDMHFAKKIRKKHKIFNVDERDDADATTNIKRKYVSLVPNENESDQSDDEKEVPEARPPCQYKIKVGILRQAYETLIEAGSKGCTHQDMAYMMGLDNATSRVMCKMFMKRNLTRQFIQDRGRAKSTRYVAVSIKADQNDAYDDEKKQFLKYMNEAKTEDTVQISEPPNKRLKLEDTLKEDNTPDIADYFIEQESNKIKPTDRSFIFNYNKPTLRQLKFVNGIIKIIKKKQILIGYHLLSSHVAEEINDSPMDSKSVKAYVKKLLQLGQLKIIKMRKPGTSTYIDLICAPNIKTTDPIIKAKFRHLNTIYLENMKRNKRAAGISAGIVKPQTFPRYMRIQKTHEVIFNTVYCSDQDYMYDDWSEIPKGFCTILHLIPEVTVGFALGNIAVNRLSDVSNCNITSDMMNLKLKDAPKEVFKTFLLSQNFQNTIRSTLKYLAMLGLIQLIQTPGSSNEKSALQFLFYVNRRAKFLNTTGVWPKEVDKKSIEREYYFESLANVEEYWAEVFRTCANTTVRRSSKPNNSLYPPEYSEDSVEENDNGQVHGNGLGACGFHSAFYMEHTRNWFMCISSDAIKTKAVAPKISISVPRRPKKLKVKKVLKPKVKRVRSRNVNKRELLTYFSPTEDKILALCRAAATIISPRSTLELLRLGNTIAREILVINDPLKSASLCHNRTLYLERSSKVFEDNDYLIYELKRKGLTKKYEGILNEGKEFHSSRNLSKAVSKAYVPGMELVYTMFQMIKSPSFKHRVPCVAADLEDFHKKFTLKPKVSNPLYNPLDSTLSAVKEGIVQTIMLTFTKELSAELSMKIYRMFKSYTEDDLQMTIEVLRSYGVISAKDKLLSNHVYKRGFQDIVQSTFKIAVAYERKWICRLNSEFVENLQELFNANLTELAQDSFKGSPELNCFLFEANASNILDLIFTTFPSVSSIRGGLPQEDHWRAKSIYKKYNLVTGKCSIVIKEDLKKFCEATKETDCKKILDAIGRNSILVQANKSDDEKGINKKILAFLKDKGVSGASFTTLLDETQLSSKDLNDKLTQLESKSLIKRIGYVDNRIVHSEFATSWTMSIEGTHFVPSHWLKFDFSIRYDIFFKWAGVIMNRTFDNPGCSIAYLANCTEMLSPRATHQICMFLEQCQCIQLKTMRITEPSLFSDDNQVTEFGEFTEYELPQNVFVFPVKNSLSCFALLRKRIFEECYASTSDSEPK